MFIRVKTTPNSPRKSVQLVESYRDNKGKPRQKIFRHVGIAQDDHELEALKNIAHHIQIKEKYKKIKPLISHEELLKQGIKSRLYKEKNKKLPIEDILAIQEEKRITTGFNDIYGEVYECLDFYRVIKKPLSKAAKILKHIVLARIAKPQSKRATCSTLAQDYGVEIPLEKIYRMMDALDQEAIDRLQKLAHRTTYKLLPTPVKVIYFDCTTLYFESFEEDELRQSGYSKDNKHQETQIILALMVSDQGLPVGYEIFSGKQWEGGTLKPMIEKVQKRFPQADSTFVADAGMFCEKNLIALEKDHNKYIVGARLRSLPKKITEQITNEELFLPINHRKDLKEHELEYKGRRLIIRWTFEKSLRDKKKREDKINKLRDKLKKSDDPKQMMKKNDVGKFIILEGDSKITLNEEKIKKEESWDGLRGLITNIDKKDMTSCEIFDRYKGLWQVEQSFRISKHDLSFRPIFHWTPERIKAHIAICFMAFSCVRYLEHRVKIQKSKNISPEKINRALQIRQCSIVRDTNTQKLYGIPSAFNADTRILYSTMGIPLNNTPFPIKQM